MKVVERKNAMKKLTVKAETYAFDELRKGLRIDIVESEDDSYYEIWMYFKDYGIKDFMFGLQKNMTKEECISLVESNLVNENYIEDYIENFAPELTDACGPIAVLFEFDESEGLGYYPEHPL